jgi:hypothetical protein
VGSHSHRHHGLRIPCRKIRPVLEVAAPSLVGRAVSLPGQRFGNWAGLALIVLGTAIIAIAAIRFLLTAKNIDSEELHPGPGLMWRLPFYSYFSAVPYSFTYLMRLSPRDKDDDAKLLQQDTSPLAGFGRSPA